jgi:glycolate oxidase
MGIIKPMAYEFENLKDIVAPIEKIVQHPSVKPLHIAYSDYMHFANQKKAGIHAPDVKNLLLITLQGAEEFVALEEQTIDKIIEEFGGKKCSDEIAEHEWDERCYEFRARKVGVGEIPAEVISPLKHFGEMIDECYKGFEAMKMEAGGVIGVVVDRSTVLYMPYYFKDDETLLGMTAFAFNFYLGDRAQAYGGRTTGFGVFFAWNLDCVHDQSTALFMRELKTCLDPHDVINPGHVVCGMTRFGIDLNKQIMGMGSSLMQSIKKLLPGDTTFADNIKRFRYDDLEERKDGDRFHELGNGAQ